MGSQSRRDTLYIGIVTERPNRSFPFVINVFLYSMPEYILLISSITTVRPPIFVVKHVLSNYGLELLNCEYQATELTAQGVHGIINLCVLV